MASMKQVEEKVLFSSALTSGLYPQMPEGEKSRTRRRRKARANEGLGAERKKRRLNDDQVKFLEMNFGNERKLESGRKMHLAIELGLDPKQVAVWFQNRRARWKNKQQEEEYMKLKSEHDATVVQKCHLENEVLSLKKRLLEAEEKIKSLSRGGGGGGGGGGGDGGGSPSSSSTETYQPLAGLGEFGVGDELMYMNEYNYITEYGYGGLFGCNDCNCNY